MLGHSLFNIKIVLQSGSECNNSARDFASMAEFCPFAPPRTLLNITSSQLLIIGPVPVFRRPSEVSDDSFPTSFYEVVVRHLLVDFPYRLPGRSDLLSSKLINRFDSRRESDRLFRVPDCPNDRRENGHLEGGT